MPAEGLLNKMEKALTFSNDTKENLIKYKSDFLRRKPYRCYIDPNIMIDVNPEKLPYIKVQTLKH